MLKYFETTFSLKETIFVIVFDRNWGETKPSNVFGSGAPKLRSEVLKFLDFIVLDIL